MRNLKKQFLRCVLGAGLLATFGSAAFGQPVGEHKKPKLAEAFESPPRDCYPETWFHLIGGNVNQEALTTDLKAVRDAGISGIQLFHGRGRAWPGVKPQIQTLSATWDSLISHVANEAARLGLNFTMQNCPGWAMSGGPWITPDKAMRHLVYSRANIVGGRRVSISLDQPQPSNEPWRDYRDIAVLAFPTPAGDDGQWLKPVKVRSFPENNAWSEWLDGKDVKIQIPVREEAAWVEFAFDRPTTLRSIELPPIEHLMKRVSFDPDSEIAVCVPKGDEWTELIRHEVPRGTWQDRQPEYPVVMAVADAVSKRYRIVFHNNRPMEITQLRLSSAARLQGWRAQAGYALRSLERSENPKQSPDAWIKRDSIVDLSGNSDADGRLTWNAPAGDWTVVRFGHVNTGVKNKPAPPEATGFECDKLSAAGAEQHFAGYIGRLSRPGGATDGGRLKGMLIDSWECYTQTWTPAMEQEFLQRRGYELRTWLPAMAGWVVDDHQTSERFLRDWRATISDLIVENYFGRMAELGRERGLNLSFETAVGDVSPGDILEYFKSADIPMCEVWQPNDPHVGGLETKPIAPTASAAHLYGKPRVAAETFTAAPMSWREHPFALKGFADRSFAAGITHVVFHTYTHNPLNKVPGTSFGSRIGTAFLRGQTWWKHMPLFNDYLARCTHMLEQGTPVADVLWYLGDDVDHKPRQDTPFPEGYHFDYVNADALLNRVNVDHYGYLVTPEDTRWRVLWLAPEQCRRLTPETLGRIKELLHAGAIVIGGAPDLNPSLSGGQEADQTFESLVAELWGDPAAESGDQKIGKGRLLWGGKLKEQLARLEIEPDVSGILSARWCHRRVGDADVYLVIGDRLRALNANLHFRAKGKPEFWNPLDGTRKSVAVYQTTDVGTSIPIQLPANGSMFVVFRPDGTAGSATAIRQVSFDEDVLLDATNEKCVDTAQPYPKYGLNMDADIQPWVEPQPPAITFSDEGQQFIAWRDGAYRFTDAQDQQTSIEVAGTKSIPLNGDWTISFPSGWDTQEYVALKGAQPWSQFDDVATRHFSGTATYETTFSLVELDPGDRVLLDLGRVGVIAEVSINGTDAGTIWAAPYRVDITDQVRPGENRLTVAVTNTWHNRLAYDASLPKNKQKTWTYAAPKPDSPLDYSGLGGPVRLHIGKLKPLPQSAIQISERDTVTDTSIPEGFEKVFNGVDLKGWKGSDDWTVEDGALTGVADGTLKSNRFIVWQGEDLRNFDLRVMVRVSEGGNSGLQYRSKLRPDLGPFRLSGYQCDIVAKNPAFNGMLYEEMGRRILGRHGKRIIIDTEGQPWITDASPVKKFESNQWHHYRVLAQGNHLKHWIDGHQTVDAIDLDEAGRSLAGVLAVQVHVGPPMKIQFKDFFLKRLPDDLPLIKSDDAQIPEDAIQVKPQGRLPKGWQPVTYVDREKIKTVKSTTKGRE